MLIRRVVKPTPPTVENHVTVVRPRRHTALLAGLGATTLISLGALAYLSWYLPPDRSAELATPAVVIAPTGRAQRFSNSPAPTPPPPTTIIVNPPAVVAPPVNPPTTQYKTPPPTIVVEGSASEPPPPANDPDSSSDNDPQ